ncbi:hypothetical protein [Allomesorhizobium camelthorni]|uniref:Right-handed parallel beta-helix repeat-containing protein n=1 Tax=Allomesorhizobium camelthorni TaxID=475069 RepID=A0A6G4WAJ9_9HYPH|nr:hypothetical protein [Mesorhizobium camelthorni]NGO51604.1 hypothetical protein [Mesorhizobium camelthorni]
MVDLADNVWRDFVTDGVPASGTNKPLKAKIREWGVWVETFVQSAAAGSSLVYGLKSSLDVALNHGPGSMGWVVADPTVANNGIYQKAGASGTGSWSRMADLPYSFIKAADAGAGTANAIVATTSVPVPSADGGALIALNIFETNTDAATVAFNGGSALTIKTNNGNDVLSGYLAAGAIVAGYVSGTTFRLISDVATSADRAAAEQAAADAAASAAGVNLPPVSAADAGKLLYVKADGTGYEKSYLRRDYRHLVDDFGLVVDGATDGRAVIATAFSTITSEGTKRRLYLPAGVTRLDYSTLVSLTPPTGLEFFGDGPEDSILEIVCTGGTRTIFNVNAADIVFRDIGLRFVSSVTGIALCFSLGNSTNLSLLGVNINGGVAFTGADPDNTLNWQVHAIQRQNSEWSGLYVDDCEWSFLNRFYLNDHLQTSAITRRVRFGSGFFGHDFFREGFAINAPGCLSEDWEFDGCDTRDCLDRSGVIHHYGIGNGKRVRVVNCNIRGAGSGIHIEESADGSVVANNVMNLTEAGATAIRLLDNNVGTGSSVSPRNIVISGNTAKGPGRNSVDSRGILFANDVTNDGPVFGANVYGNIMEGFERGYAADDDQRFVNAFGNIARDCFWGYWATENSRRLVRDRFQNNQAVDCMINYRHDNVSFGLWGGKNSAAVREMFGGAYATGRWTPLLGSDGTNAIGAAVSPATDLRLTSGDGAAASVAVNGTALVGSFLQYRAADGRLRFDVKMRIRISVAAVGAFIGFTDQNSTLEFPIELGAAGAITSNASNAVGFCFHTIMDDPDRWVGLGVKNDVDTAVMATGTAPVLDTYQVLSVEVNTDGSADFFIDNTQVGSTLANAVDPTVFLTPIMFIYSRTTQDRRIEAEYAMASVGP